MDYSGSGLGNCLKSLWSGRNHCINIVLRYLAGRDERRALDHRGKGVDGCVNLLLVWKSCIGRRWGVN